MKKLLLLATLVLGVVSCMKDQSFEAGKGGETDFVLSVALPSEATRAIGQNSALGAIDNGIDLSQYDIRYVLGVYDANGNLAKRDVKYEDATETTFALRLIPGRDYRFVVWADFVQRNAEGVVTLAHYDVEDLTNIKLIGDQKAMDETRDAYTDVVKIEKFNGASTVELELKRPFAKLRVVTNDMDELYTQAALVSGKVVYTQKVYTTFNALTAEAGDLDNVEKEFLYNDATSYTENADDEKTLFADYLFGAENDVIYFTLDVEDATGLEIDQVVFNTNIPVKRNHLTTIYGPVLTDANSVSVKIDDNFAQPEYVVEVWDGVTVTEPAYDAATKTYTVINGAELAWVAAEVNNGTKFEGKTVVLDRNIDLGREEWTPIGCSGKYFDGTFDGCGHVVGNFLVTRQEGHAGLFGNARAIIKNLTVVDAKIVANHYAGGIVGQGYVKVDNCHVNNIDITLTTKNGDLGDKAGGLVGQNCEGTNMYITNSSAKNVKIQGYRDLGGIAGMAHRGNKVTGCSVENITILQDLSVNYETTTPTTLAGVVGRVHANIGEYANNTESNVEVSVIIAEGLTQNVDTETYTVSSVEGLQVLAEIVENEPSADIVLGGDIDLSQFVITRSMVSNWTPIGTSEKPYTGTFDGNGCTIKNLTLVESEAKEGKAYIGFFGYAKNATIKNVTFENVYINIPCLDIDHSQGHIGAVAGSLEGTSTIENVTVKGDVQIYATQNANGASRVAVIAGGNAYGDVTMKNVHVIANEGSYLTANNNTGALAGQLQGKMYFENCSSNIDVTVNKFFAGGLVGIAAGDSKFVNCHTSGDVAVVAGRAGRANDHYRVGGIAGGWADGKTKVCTLEGCSYTGKVSGKNSDGSVAEVLDYAGYVGRGYTLTNCAGSTVIIDGAKYVQAYDNVYGVYYYNGAIMDVAGVKAIILEVEDGFMAVSVEEKNLKGLNATDAAAWAEGLGEGWSLASIYELDAIHAARKALNVALAADNAENALFCETDYYTAGKYALYISSTAAEGNDPQGTAYYANRVHVKYFNLNGYWDYPYSTFATINKSAPLKDNYFARAVYAL